MEKVNILEQIRQDAPVISVGILAADMMHLAKEIELMEQADVKLAHFDVMDGHFCPSLTIGPPFIKGIKTKLLKDVHLMIEDPLDKLESFVQAGADILTINMESTKHIHRALQMLGQMKNVNDPHRGILRGVVLNPGTALEMVQPLMPDLEVIFLLAVNPGWGGQRFISSTREKFSRLAEMVRSSKRDILVGIDGGINKENIAEVAALGADIIVSGSAVFDGKDPLGNAKFMMKALSNSPKRKS